MTRAGVAIMRPSRRRQARPRAIPLPYRQIGHRDLSYGALPPLAALVVRHQAWVLVPADTTLDDPSLLAIASECLLEHLEQIDGLTAFCCAFYTRLDLTAELGCLEWAPKGQWYLAGLSAATRDYSQHCWTRHHGELLPFISFLDGLASSSGGSRDVENVENRKESGRARK